MVALQSIFPQQGNLPVFRGKPSQPIAFAMVDEWLLPLITSLGPWYISDLREVTSPRISIREESGKKRTLPLSRAVVAIMVGIADKTMSGRVITPIKVWYAAQHLAPVRFDNGNPFNCESSNLRIGGVLVGVTKEQVTVPEPINLVNPVLERMSIVMPVTAPFDSKPTDPLAAQDIGAKRETIDSVRELLKLGQKTSP